MATLTINTDEKTAENFYAFCEELGLDMSTAINLFMKACLREKRIPFSVSIDPFYSNENIKALENSINEVKDGKVIMKTIEELEEN